MYSNKFILNVIRDVNEIVVGDNKVEFSSDRSTNRDRLSRKQKYVVDIHQVVIRMQELFTQFSIIVEGIENISIDEDNMREEQKHMDIIRYHTEVFLYKTHTFLELMKIMVNRCYSFGLSDNQCKWNRLSRIQPFNNSDSFHIINDYSEMFGPLIENRHMNSHRGFINDTSMKEIDIRYGGYILLKSMNEDLDKVKNSRLDREIFILLTQLQKDRLKLINETKDLITKQLDKFFDSLDSVYQKRLSRLL